MKEYKVFIVELVIGIIMAVIGLLTMTSWDYYSSMIFAGGFGLSCGALVHLFRIAYWTNPKRQKEYEAKKREQHINAVDERMQYLRMRAGQVSYQITLIALVLVAAVLALVRGEAWVIRVLLFVFIAQWILYSIVYHVLKKRL